MASQQLAHLRLLSHQPHGIILRIPASSSLQLRLFASKLGAQKGSVKRHWTKEEVARLQELWTDGKSWQDVAAALPGRTAHACHARYRKIPNRPQQNVHWSKEQLARLLELREKGGTWNSIAAEFPGRSPKAAQSAHIRITGAKKKKCLWNGEDLALLRRMRQRRDSWKKIDAAFPTRTLSALMSKASTMTGLPSRKKYRWTQEETARLLELKASGATWSTVKASFPGLSLYTLQRHYAAVGPRSQYGRLIYGRHATFTDEERDKIHRLHGEGKSHQEIHAAVCPDKDLSRMLAVLKNGRRGDELDDTSRFRKRWTRPEDKTLLTMRQKDHKTFKEIALTMGRSYLGTTNRYYKITEETVRPAVPSPKRYTPAERAKVAHMVKLKAPVKEMAAAIGRTPNGMFNHLFKNRSTLGFLRGTRLSWQMRRNAVIRIRKFREQGLQWKEIQEQMPEFSLTQLKSYYQTARRTSAHSMPKGLDPVMTESDRQRIASRIRSMRLRGMDWSTIGLRFPQFPVNRVRRIYIEANSSGKERPRAPGTPGTGRRSRDEVDVHELLQYKSQGLKWSEIQAHMPDWSASTLQKVYTESRPKVAYEDKALGKKEVQQIARYKSRGYMWKEIQEIMPIWTESQLRRAYRKGEQNGILRAELG